MDHLAILKKSGRLLDKIISGEKTVESRWMKNRITPWNNIKSGETIYFKESGMSVTARAIVDNVIFIESPNKNISLLFRKYGKAIGFSNIQEMKQYSRGKNYCVLIFLKDVRKVKPFDIDKKGFGLMSAWITVKNISEIKKK